MRYRDAVAELVRAGEPFSDVEHAIDELADIPLDEKDALWLLAFSLRERTERERDARTRLAAVQ